MTSTPAAPRATTRRHTPTREPIAVLASVLYDKDASTPFNELYHAASDTAINRVYDVRYDVRRAAWSCNCPATVPCKHERRAARLRLLRWWRARLLECTNDELRAERTRRLARVDAEQADEDDYGALDAIALRLDYSEAA